MDDSSRIRRKKEEEELIININNQSTIINKSLVRSFCFPFSKANILLKFEKIARREKGHRGFSSMIQELIINHVKAHERGNAQLKLLNYVDPDAPSPHHVLCFSCKGVTREGKIFCTNPKIVKSYEMTVEKRLRGKWISGIQCYSCKFNRLRKK